MRVYIILGFFLSMPFFGYGQIQYANFNQTYNYGIFLADPSSGSGSVNVRIQNNILTVTFNASFTSSRLKFGQVIYLPTSPQLPGIYLGTVTSSYPAYIENGYLSIAGAQVHISGFNATLVFDLNTATQPPVALLPTSIGMYNFTANWSSEPGATKYGLQVSSIRDFSNIVYSSNNETSTSKTISGLVANTTYYYRVKVKKDQSAYNESVYSNAISVTTLHEPMNYVKEINVLSSGISTIPESDAAMNFEKNIKYSFVDGLGRTIQVLDRQGSPLKKDIVQTIVYDQHGRESVKYLPYVSDENNGLYKSNSIGTFTEYNLSPQRLFYNGTTPKITNDEKPYAVTVIEPSPVNRVRKRGSFGSVWQPAEFADTYADFFQSWPYSDFLPIDVGGGGSVSVRIQNDVLTVQFNAGFSNSTLKTGGVKVIESSPSLPDLYLGLIAAGKYIVSIKNGMLYFENNGPGPAIVSSFGSIFTIQLKERTVKSEYQHNTSNEVLVWTYDPSTHLNNPRKSNGEFAYYNPNELSANRTYDEHNRAVIEYIDKKGRTILKRVQAGNSSTPVDDTNYASTYYVYDDFGSLVTVVPPEAVARLSTEYPYPQNDFMDKWAFRYKYDARRRMIEKKSPGAAPVYMVYDKRDRLVLTQDGNQRAKSPREWTFTKYDALNRPVLTGIFTDTNGLSQQAMQQAVNDFYVSAPLSEKAGDAVHGYTNQSFPTVIDPAAYLTVTYYDDYGFKVSLNNTSFDYLGTELVTEGNNPAQKENEFVYVNGQVTGMKVKNLNNNTWSWTVNYYDDHYRVIQSVMHNHLGGMDRVTNVYDFPGRLLRTRTTHVTSETIVSVVKRFTYDHAGRLISEYHKTGDAPEVMLLKNRYNELGQLITKKLYFKSSSGQPVAPDPLIGQSGVYYDDSFILNHYNGATGYVAKTSINLKPGFQVAGTPGKQFTARIGLNPQDADDHNNSLEVFAQEVDYRYNVRGWLDNINDVNAAGTDLFSMDLNYNLPGINGGAAQYNGNISEARWKSPDGVLKSYGYYYDPMNRIVDGRYYAPSQNGRYNEKIGDGERKAYDLNGNIQNLIRHGKTGENAEGIVTYGLMDNLTYTYTGNHLLEVDEAQSTTGIDGFTDGTNSGNDYDYDPNGNMAHDLNKGIGSNLSDQANKITYNHLNLPQRVQKSPNDYIEYHYDATGRKLRQVAVEGGITKTTDYVSEFVYENSVLQFISHEEGRVVMTGTEPEYQYHLKDHLGNVRVTFTTRQETESATATLEDASQAEESSRFLRYNDVRRVRSNLMDHTNDFEVGVDDPDTHNDDGYAIRLSGAENEKFGIATSISVMPGDKVSTEVYAKYIDPEDAANPQGALISLLGAIANPASAPGTVVDGSNYVNSTSSFLFPAEAALVTAGSSGASPKAYLNWLVFDRDYNLILSKSGYRRISTSPKESGQNVAHERLFSPQIAITQPGYVYIYVSNEEGSPVEVFFDDFKVEHVKSAVVQMDDYYPFGWTFNSYKREGSLENKWKFQGQEHVDDLGLGWIAFKWRNHDPAIGRFFNVDPLSEKFYNNSPYAFSENKVTGHVELEGLESFRPSRPAHYHNLQNYRSAVRAQLVRTSYNYSNRMENYNGPRERVFVGSYEEPQTRKGEVVTALLNLADANGVEGKLKSLQISIERHDKVSTNGLGGSSTFESKYAFSGPDAGKLEVMESEYQQKANAAFDEKFASFASEKLGKDFNSLSAEEQAQFRVENMQSAGLIRMGVQQELGPSPKQTLINGLENALQQGVLVEQKKTEELPVIRQGF